MSEYTKELEDHIERLKAELRSVQNDKRLSDGAYAMCNSNLNQAQADIATLTASRDAAITREHEARGRVKLAEKSCTFLISQIHQALGCGQIVGGSKLDLQRVFEEELAKSKARNSGGAEK